MAASSAAFNERADYMAGLPPRRWRRSTSRTAMRIRAPIEREPHGVVLVIAPWNYPYMTAINTVAPALIAGNTVILKHATPDAAGGRAHGRGLHEAGLPEDVFQNLFLDHDTRAPRR
jgi:acyl-CoA reductase-like NAD-dependent aldehyde dehydrogenase